MRDPQGPRSAELRVNDLSPPLVPHCHFKSPHDRGAAPAQPHPATMARRAATAILALLAVACAATGGGAVTLYKRPDNQDCIPATTTVSTFAAIFPSQFFLTGDTSSQGPDSTTVRGHIRPAAAMHFKSFQMPPLLLMHGARIQTQVTVAKDFTVEYFPTYKVGAATAAAATTAGPVIFKSSAAQRQRHTAHTMQVSLFFWRLAAHDQHADERDVHPVPVWRHPTQRQCNPGRQGMPRSRALLVLCSSADSRSCSLRPSTQGLVPMSGLCQTCIASPVAVALTSPITTPLQVFEIPLTSLSVPDTVPYAFLVGRIFACRLLSRFCRPGNVRRRQRQSAVQQCVADATWGFPMLRITSNDRQLENFEPGAACSIHAPRQQHLPVMSPM